MGTGPVKALLLWTLALSASYFDFRWRKVPNLLILAGAFCGVAVAAWGGTSGLLRGVYGLLLGAALLFPFFLLGGVGGGDVKSLAVIGLFTGPSLLLASFFWGACAGGGMALFYLLSGRKANRKGGLPRPGKATPPTLPYAALLFLTAAFLVTRAAI